MPTDSGSWCSVDFQALTSCAYSFFLANTSVRISRASDIKRNSVTIAIFKPFSTFRIFFGKQSSVLINANEFFCLGFCTCKWNWKTIPWIIKKLNCKHEICAKKVVLWKPNLIALCVFNDFETCRTCKLMISLEIVKFLKKSIRRFFNCYRLCKSRPNYIKNGNKSPWTHAHQTVFSRNRRKQSSSLFNKHI